MPTHWAEGSPLSGLGSMYNLGWRSQTIPAHTVTTTVVRIQLLVYGLPQGKLLWSADSETTDPGSGSEDDGGRNPRPPGLLREGTAWDAEDDKDRP